MDGFEPPCSNTLWVAVSEVHVAATPAGMNGKRTRIIWSSCADSNRVPLPYEGRLHQFKVSGAKLPSWILTVSANCQPHSLYWRRSNSKNNSWRDSNLCARLFSSCGFTPTVSHTTDRCSLFVRGRNRTFRLPSRGILPYKLQEYCLQFT